MFAQILVNILIGRRTYDIQIQIKADRRQTISGLKSLSFALDLTWHRNSSAAVGN